MGVAFLIELSERNGRVRPESRERRLQIALSGGCHQPRHLDLRPNRPRNTQRDAGALSRLAQLLHARTRRTTPTAIADFFDPNQQASR